MGEPAIDKKAGTVADTEVTVPLPPLLVELIVWLGQVPVIVTFVPATRAGVAVPVPPLATSKRPENEWLASHAAAPAVVKLPSAAVLWLMDSVMPKSAVYKVYANKSQ